MTHPHRLKASQPDRMAYVRVLSGGVVGMGEQQCTSLDLHTHFGEHVTVDGYPARNVA